MTAMSYFPFGPQKKQFPLRSKNVLWWLALLLALACLLGMHSLIHA